jgi:hypothetical protein
MNEPGWLVRYIFKLPEMAIIAVGDMLSGTTGGNASVAMKTELNPRPNLSFRLWRLRNG